MFPLLNLFLIKLTNKPYKITSSKNVDVFQKKTQVNILIKRLILYSSLKSRHDIDFIAKRGKKYYSNHIYRP